MRKVLKATLAIYLLAVACGLGIIAWSTFPYPRLEVVLGLLILTYTSLPWPLLLKIDHLSQYRYALPLALLSGNLINTSILLLALRLSKRVNSARS